MTDKQKIFEGLSYDWRWASWSRCGSAAVHRDTMPGIEADLIIAKKENTCAREEYNEDIPPEGIEPFVIERVLPEIVTPMAATNGHGVPLHLQKPVPPPPATVPPAPVFPSNAQMFTQDVFLEDLSNGKLCKYAALNADGVVWLFEAKPTLYGTDFMTYGYSQRLEGKFKAVGTNDPVVIQKDYGSVTFVRQSAPQAAPVAPQFTYCKNLHCGNDAMQGRDECETCYLNEATKPYPPAPIPEPFIETQPTEHEHVLKIRKKEAEFANLGHEPEGPSNYSMGVFNGLELAISAIQDRDPQFRFTLREVDDFERFNVKQVDAMNRATAATNQELINSTNAIHKRVKVMFDNEELTVTQVCAILGEFPW